MKKIIALAVLASALFFGGAKPASAATYDVIGIGDSIGKQFFPTTAVGTPRWLNAQPSRAPYVSGEPGTSISCVVTCLPSTVENSTIGALTAFIGSSEPGGYVIVQDGGWGDRYGVYTTLQMWKDFVQDVIDIVPNDRTLVFVYPANDPVEDQAAQDVMYARVIAARDILNANPSQPHIKINWWLAVENNDHNSPTPYTKPDGLHPSAHGVLWLASQVTAAVS